MKNPLYWAMLVGMTVLLMEQGKVHALSFYHLCSFSLAGWESCVLMHNLLCLSLVMMSHNGMGSSVQPHAALT